MKSDIKPSPNHNEILMKDDDFIVSKTDPKGRLSYVNQIFMDFSGYTESQLLGVQHNIVRHPDMPRGVFHLLWTSLQQGKEFNGYIKNLCADGSYYWVFANVTASYASNGDLLGYYSVRRKPRKDALEMIKPLYKDMVTAEKRAGSRDAVNASMGPLNDILNNKQVSYDEFIFTI